uniref:Uncharacterized protein n=1 Tax=Rhizophora mucronata TaxID=61149 RepID=A0A2P2PK63_RHIMU
MEKDIAAFLGTKPSINLISILIKYIFHLRKVCSMVYTQQVSLPQD